MTPSDQTLCKAIAEEEYPDVREDPDGDLWIFLKGTRHRPIPAYLTDPAEKWRMLEALVDAGFVISRNCSTILHPDHGPSIIIIPDDEFVRAVGIINGRCMGGKARKLKYAVAEAFKAMLIAKREGGEGEG